MRYPECKLSPSDSGIDLEITHGDKLDYHTKDERLAFRSWLIELLAKLIPRIFLVSDLDLYLTQLSQDEGFNRALENADVSIALTNILGGTPKFRLSEWETTDIRERFPLKRQSLLERRIGRGGLKSGKLYHCMKI